MVANACAQTHLFLIRCAMIAHLSFTKSSSRQQIVACLTLTNFPITYASVFFFFHFGDIITFREASTAG